MIIASFLSETGGQIASFTTTSEFIVGVLIGLSVGYLAGCWRGRYRVIGSKPKHRPVADGVVARDVLYAAPLSDSYLRQWHTCFLPILFQA